MYMKEPSTGVQEADPPAPADTGADQWASAQRERRTSDPSLLCALCGFDLFRGFPSHA